MRIELLNWIHFLRRMVVAATVLIAVGAAVHVGVPDIAPHISPQVENQALLRPW